VYALWGPDTSALRTQIAARAVSAAEASGDPRLEFASHLAAYNVAIESADHVTAVRSMARIRAIAQLRSEPRLRWTASLLETFEATMAGRLVEAEARATHNLELGLQIGEPDAFTFFAGQFFVIGTFGGRHADLLPIVEQTARDNPDMLAFELAHAIVLAAVGREKEARACLHAGMRRGFGSLPPDNIWTTSIIGYAVIAIELDDVDAAAELLPVVEPFGALVAFNGMSSQGPISAYVGKLASLVGAHDLAEESLHDALTTATAFGWHYHRATTLVALAQARRRRFGKLDDEAHRWLAEAGSLCREGGYNSWLPKVEELLT
jgi:hypothetical protein